MKNSDVEIGGIIFNIQRYTIHDGPGIRTEVFFKGCPLRCKWCSNPEGIKGEIEVGVYSNRCIGVEKCGHCLAVCPQAKTGVLIVEDSKVAKIEREKCSNCGKCAEHVRLTL